MKGVISFIVIDLKVFESGNSINIYSIRLEIKP